MEPLLPGNCEAFGGNQMKERIMKRKKGIGPKVSEPALAPVRLVIIDDQLDDWRLVLEGLPWRAGGENSSLNVNAAGFLSSRGTMEERAGERRPSFLGNSSPPVRVELLASFNSMFLALPLLEQGGVDAVLLGAGLPWLEGQPSARFLQRRWPKLVVILVLGKDAKPGRDPASAPEEFPCLPQNFSGEELVAVITNAIRAARGLAEPAGSLAPSPTFSAHQLWIQEKKLKSREVAALNFVREGLLDKEIAGKMNCSDAITKKILRRAYAKLGIHHRAEAIKIWNAAPP